MGMIHVIKQKKAEEAQAKIAGVVRELRGETERSVKGFTSEMEKEQAGLHSLPGVRLVTWTIPAVINWYL
jgi:hypothetical protein